jgi:hypothetical protein
MTDAQTATNCACAVMSVAMVRAINICLQRGAGGNVVGKLCNVCRYVAGAD